MWHTKPDSVYSSNNHHHNTQDTRWRSKHKRNTPVALVGLILQIASNWINIELTGK